MNNEGMNAPPEAPDPMVIPVARTFQVASTSSVVQAIPPEAIRLMRPAVTSWLVPSTSGSTHPITATPSPAATGRIHAGPPSRARSVRSRSRNKAHAAATATSASST